MIKGVLFDKDGTIIDFFAVWPTLAREVIPKFIRQNEIFDNDGSIERDLLERMGLSEDRVDPRGAFAYKSYGEIADDICAALTDHGVLIEVYSIYMQIKDLFKNTIKNTTPIYKTFTDMPDLMRALKKRNIFIGLATADIQESAELMLNDLYIMEFFDYIGADDGTRKPKPDGEMIKEFREITGLKAEEILVVGDTFNDMLFGRQNGTKTCGVLSGVSAAEDYDDMADYIIDSIADLPELLDKINAE